jgi:hypothetical protein
VFANAAMTITVDGRKSPIKFGELAYGMLGKYLVRITGVYFNSKKMSWGLFISLDGANINTLEVVSEYRALLD